MLVLKKLHDHFKAYPKCRYNKSMEYKNNVYLYCKIKIDFSHYALFSFVLREFFCNFNRVAQFFPLFIVVTYFTEHCL